AEAARLEANQTARPWGVSGATPEQTWLGRRPVVPTGRTAFATVVRRHRVEARREQGLPPDGPLPPPLQAAADRTALRRSLAEHGLLTYTSGRGIATRPRNAPVDAHARTP